MTKFECFAAFLVAIFNNLIAPKFGAQLGARSLPVIPFGDNELAPSVAVAGAIKPKLTPGGIASDLHLNKGDSVDRKIAVYVPINGLCRVAMFPDATLLAAIIDASTDTLVANITPDEPDKQVTSHTIAPESGMEADAEVVAIMAELEEVKPRRNGGSLINALVDVLQAQQLADGEDPAPYVLLIEQDNDTVSLYRGQPGTMAGKEADVTQEAAEDDEDAVSGLI